MGIVVSSCKGKSSVKNELSPQLRLNRDKPSKREQRFKTYKISKKKTSLEEKRATSCQDSCEKSCKSLDCLNKSDKYCQVEIFNKYLIHRATSTDTIAAKSRTKSPKSFKMNHRRSKNNDLHHHYHHYHHHYHHRNHRGSRFLMNLDKDDNRDSPTISILSDLEAEIGTKPNLSIFTNLYNQGKLNKQIFAFESIFHYFLFKLKK